MPSPQVVRDAISRVVIGEGIVVATINDGPGAAHASSTRLNLATAGVGSTLPEASVARTLNLPSFSFLSVKGDEQDPNFFSAFLTPLPFARHWNVEPTSSDENCVRESSSDGRRFRAKPKPSRPPRCRSSALDEKS